MTPRLWVLLSLASGLVVLGLAARRGEILALALILLAYFALAVFALPGSVRLEAGRSLKPDRAPYGKPVPVQLTLQNQGPRLPEVELVDMVTPRLAAEEGQDRRILMLNEGETAELAYIARGERGRYRFEGVRAAVRDPFGLFCLEETFPARAQLFIFPEVAQLRRAPVRPQRTHGFAGPIPARRAGSGVDFFGVRGYQAGDSLRHINWRLSARHPRDLFTNEFEQESITDVGIILDARDVINVPVRGRPLFEYSVEAAAALAEMFLADGHRVGLLEYGFRNERVFPGYGTVQKERILRSLAEAQTGKNYVLESLNYLPTRFFPPRSQLVLISPLIPDDLATLSRLRGRGYSVLVVSPNPIDDRGEENHASGRDYAVRFAQLERTLLLRKLRRVGVAVVDWRPGEPLSRLLQVALAQQPAQLTREVFR